MLPFNMRFTGGGLLQVGLVRKLKDNCRLRRVLASSTRFGGTTPLLILLYIQEQCAKGWRQFRMPSEVRSL